MSDEPERTGEELDQKLDSSQILSDDLTDLKTYPTGSCSGLSQMPVWDLAEPGGVYQLYKGRMQVTGTSFKSAETGTVTLEFSPRLQVKLRYDATNIRIMADNEVSVQFESISTDGTLSKISNQARTLYTNRNISFGSLADGAIKVEAIIAEPLHFYPDARIGRILFHLLNFRDYSGDMIHMAGGFGWTGRQQFTFGKWKVTLDRVRESKERLDTVEKKGGYVVTTVGILEKQDGTLFGQKEACKALEVLTWTFTFANGGRCPCFLAHGYRYLKDHVWLQAQASLVSSEIPQSSWFSQYRAGEALSVASGIQRLFQNKDDSEWLRLAIGLYCEANRSGSGIDMALAKSQIVLELLSSVIAQEQRVLISEGGFEKLPAADRIRIALLWAGIPSGIPKYLNAMKRAFGDRDIPDGPTAITELRNALIHPTREKRRMLSRIDSSARAQSLALSMHYVELLMLKLLGYDGAYKARFKIDDRPRLFNVVPWSSDQNAGILPGKPEDYEMKITYSDEEAGADIDKESGKD